MHEFQPWVSWKTPDKLDQETQVGNFDCSGGVDSDLKSEVWPSQRFYANPPPHFCLGHKVRLSVRMWTRPPAPSQENKKILTWLIFAPDYLLVPFVLKTRKKFLGSSGGLVGEAWGCKNPHPTLASNAGNCIKTLWLKQTHAAAYLAFYSIKPQISVSFWARDICQINCVSKPKNDAQFSQKLTPESCASQSVCLKWAP